MHRLLRSFLEHIDDNPFSDTFTAFQLQVLELCRLLWGPVKKPSNVHLINPDYFDAQSRRKMLSHWLYQAILSEPREEVGSLIALIDLTVFSPLLVAVGNAEL